MSALIEAASQGRLPKISQAEGIKPRGSRGAQTARPPQRAIPFKTPQPLAARTTIAQPPSLRAGQAPRPLVPRRRRLRRTLETASITASIDTRFSRDSSLPPTRWGSHTKHNRVGLTVYHAKIYACKCQAADAVAAYAVVALRGNGPLLRGSHGRRRNAVLQPVPPEYSIHKCRPAAANIAGVIVLQIIVGITLIENLPRLAPNPRI